MSDGKPYAMVVDDFIDATSMPDVDKLTKVCRLCAIEHPIGQLSVEGFCADCKAISAPQRAMLLALQGVAEQMRINAEIARNTTARGDLVSVLKDALIDFSEKLLDVTTSLSSIHTVLTDLESAVSNMDMRPEFNMTVEGQLELPHPLKAAIEEAGGAIPVRVVDIDKDIHVRTLK